MSPSHSVAAGARSPDGAKRNPGIPLSAGPGFRGACHRAGHFGPDPLAPSGLQDQFRDRSTNARCLIQGIISRSFAPTCSIGCSASLARVALNEVWFTLFSSIQSLVKRPDWISARTFFISARVWSVMTRGPETYSPYSAVFDTE